MEKLLSFAIPTYNRRDYVVKRENEKIMYLKADITAAVNYLKWRPSFDVRSGLEEVVAYYRNTL